MAQLIVRNLDEDVKERLQRRAKEQGCSLEEMIRDILRNAANDYPPSGGLGSEIAALFKDLDFDFEIPEWRGYPVQPMNFDDDDHSGYERPVGSDPASSGSNRR